MTPSPPFALSRWPTSAKVLATGFLALMAANVAFALRLAWALSHSAIGSSKEHFELKGSVYLLRMSHQHVFGHGVMFFILGALFAGTRMKDGWKALWIGSAFAAALVEVGGWWLQKYGAPDMEPLLAACGAVYTASFLVMAGAVLRELWGPVLRPQNP